MESHQSIGEMQVVSMNRQSPGREPSPASNTRGNREPVIASFPMSVLKVGNEKGREL